MRTASRHVIGLLFIALLTLAGGSSASAEEAICPICQRAGNAGAPYGEKMGNTLVRGTANTLMGWTEIIRQPAEEAKKGGNVLAGLANGLGRSIQRTAAGIGEVLTFWTPKMNEEYVQFAQDCPICMGNKASVAATQQAAAQDVANRAKSKAEAKAKAEADAAAAQ